MTNGIPPAWADIEPYLDQVLDLEPPQREQWLAQLQTTKPDLAHVVRRLLAEQNALNAAGFLQQPLIAQRNLIPELDEVMARIATADQSDLALAAHARTLAAGAIVGPYRLLRQIGAGGTSSVWLAERCDGQLERAVALKLPLIATPVEVEGFLRERRILAALTHPNIARLYDTGVTESGQPYLAMEYVEGTALLHSCDAQRLTVRARLQLFLRVLDAVQFAHGQLIIHRDLKPPNILVSAAGHVTLLDFGIGKLLSEDSAQATRLGRALTPDYASPEQIEGRTLGVASDIYSLGVILYELLTGTRPYVLKRDSLGALEDAILTEDVKRPSQIPVSSEIAAARSSSVRGLRRALSGDLDTIVRKALKKNPAERYVSVTAFAQDIANHLHDLPVSARPDSYWYRAGRFVSRNKIPVAAATVVLLAILGSAILALWQARALAVQRDRAVALSESNDAVSAFMTLVLADASDAEKPITVKELLQRAEKLASGTGNSEVNAAVLELIAASYYSVNEAERSLAAADQALALLAKSPNPVARSRLQCQRASVIAVLGEPDAAIATIKGELRGLDADPKTAGACLTALAEICRYACRPGDLLRYAQQGVDRLHGVRGQEDNEAWLLSLVGAGYHQIGRNDEANRYFEQSLQRFRQIGRENSPSVALLLNNWSIVLNGAGAPKQAADLQAEALRRSAQRDPDSEPPVSAVVNYNRSLLEVGRFAEAREGLEHRCKTIDEQFTGTFCQLNIAWTALEMRDLERAQEALDRASALVDPSQRPLLRQIAMLQGRLDVAQGRPQAASVQFDRALVDSQPGLTMVMARIGKAEVALLQGDTAAAIKDSRLAIQAATDAQGGLQYSNRTGLGWLMLGRALHQQGEPGQARDALHKAIVHLSHSVDATHPQLLQAHALLDKVRSPSAPDERNGKSPEREHEQDTQK